MQGRSYWLQQLTRLSLLKGIYSPGSAEQKMKLLHQLATCPLKDPRFIKKYHDCLLFFCSQPDNSIILQLAEDGLEKVTTEVENIYSGNSISRQASLNGTGIIGTEMICCFSYDIARWLYTMTSPLKTDPL